MLNVRFVIGIDEGNGAIQLLCPIEEVVFFWIALRFNNIVPC
jgi:hypothetical protein